MNFDEEICRNPLNCADLCGPAALGTVITLSASAADVYVVAVVIDTRHSSRVIRNCSIAIVTVFLQLQKQPLLPLEQD